MVRNIRQYWVLMHRYVGLSMAVFLVVAGVTGSIITFYRPLDRAINPDLYKIKPANIEGKAIDPVVLREQLQAKYPTIQIGWVPLQPVDHDAVIYTAEPKINLQTGKPYVLGYNQLFVNPYTGNVQGVRTLGDLSEGAKNLIPFIYQLHQELALGVVGKYLMGIIAVLWTVDCFVGAYLTFPRKTRNQRESKSLAKQLLTWIRRWQPAWKVRIKPTNPHKINFDLHHAGGLWMWAMLLVLAWSSVALNLNREVYSPVMNLFFEMQDARSKMPKLSQPNNNPQLSYADARTIALHYLNTPNPHKLTQIEPLGMSYIPQVGLYHYRFVSNQDIHSSRGNTRMYIDANTGEVMNIYIPVGKASGDTVTTWIRALHMADLWGLPFKVFVSLMGVVVVMLSVTGVYLWWKKRKARLKYSSKVLAN
ncbi:MAG: PepSY-associated TM helix domain-containing protein [Methylophilus sp.]|nr:PepSY-associated TM helix domain-containing protein [Methylophilus sp.]